MRILNRGIPLVAALLLYGCASAFDVYHVPKSCNACGNEFGEQSLFYALPKTIITVDAVVDKKVVTDGPCKASVALLGPNVKALVSATELGATTIGSRVEADPDQIYAIKLSRRWYQKVTSSFSLSEIGLLTAAEMAVENQAVDFAVTTLKTAAGIASKVITAGGSVAHTPTECEKIRDEIERLRDVRGKLIEGKQTANFPPDGAALNLMLDKLIEQEKALTAKFIGSVKLTTGSVHCETTPGPAEADAKLTIFAIAKDGIRTIGTNCRVPADLMGTTDAISGVFLKLTTNVDTQLAGIARAAAGDRNNPSGLAYRIPATADIEVLEGQVSKAFDRRVVAQFGSIASLPRSADVAAFQSTVKAALYPSTGAMQKLDFSGTPQGTGAVTGVAETAGSIFDAKAAARKAEVAANDELALLERQRKILEERKKIIDLGGTPGKADD